MTKSQEYRWSQQGDRRKEQQDDRLPPQETSSLRRRKTDRAGHQRPTVKRKFKRRAPKHALHPA